jgi:electron transport complex protein RnfG
MKEDLGFKSMLRLGFILAAFATAACVMLAFVYDGTKTIIEERQEADRIHALEDLFPDADEFIRIDGLRSPDLSVAIEAANAAIKYGNVIGAALNLSRSAYSGAVKTMVGVSADGLITGVKIMEHTETPGLGANAGNPKYFIDRANGITFYGQFAGKKVTDPFHVHRDVVAISASTITSVAVSASVRAAGLAVAAWIDGGEADAITSATSGGER